MKEIQTTAARISREMRDIARLKKVVGETIRRELIEQIEKERQVGDIFSIGITTIDTKDDWNWVRQLSAEAFDWSQRDDIRWAHEAHIFMVGYARLLTADEVKEFGPHALRAALAWLQNPRPNFPLQ